MSSKPAARSSAGSTSCSCGQTPASVQSRSRRHAVTPLQPTCSAGLPDVPCRAAADAINNLAALPRTPADSPATSPQGITDLVFLRAVPAWETDAL
ncbi:hypothetical protein OHA04_42605 (plasmid) [Streptomyces sp. NBC_01590]